MLVRVERLLLRLRQPASRADEVSALRARVRAEAAVEVDEDERTLAREVDAAKRRVAGLFGAVSSCRSCAVGHPRPVGQHDGGACCAGVSAELFDDRELAALVHAGTRAGDLTPPAGSDVPAGCSFRGAHGCSLDVAHRPARCVHYVCDTLRREVHAHGRLDALEAALAELDRAMRRFGAAREARLEREAFAPLADALASAVARAERR